MLSLFVSLYKNNETINNNHLNSFIMCTNSNSNGTGLTRGQEILNQVNVAEAIKSEVNNIIVLGFIPRTISVSDFFYNKLKSQFCEDHGIFDESTIELKSFIGVRLQNVGVERNFTQNGEFVLPIRVSYTLPEQEQIVHQLEDSNDSNDSDDDNNY